MLIAYDEFARRADDLRARIAQACAVARRDSAEVELLAVTKIHLVAAVEYASRYGLRVVGENWVQEGVAKRAEVFVVIGLCWEFIGHLQSNKAKFATQHFD